MGAAKKVVGMVVSSPFRKQIGGLAVKQRVLDISYNSMNRKLRYTWHAWETGHKGKDGCAKLFENEFNNYQVDVCHGAAEVSYVKTLFRPYISQSKLKEAKRTFNWNSCRDREMQSVRCPRTLLGKLANDIKSLLCPLLLKSYKPPSFSIYPSYEDGDTKKFTKPFLRRVSAGSMNPSLKNDPMRSYLETGVYTNGTYHMSAVANSSFFVGVKYMCCDKKHCATAKKCSDVSDPLCVAL